MTGLVLWGAIVSAALLCLRAPFAFVLIYIWIEYFRPQEVAPAQFAWISISLTVGVFAAIGMIIAAQKNSFRPSVEFFWLLTLALWITLTTTWAVVPAAWIKWDTAIKTVLFCALLSQLTWKAEQVEAILLAIIAGSAAQICSFGIKGLITGGGYQQELGVVGGNAGLAESSTLAVFSAAMVPFYWFIANNSILLRKNIVLRLAAISGTFLTVSAIIATNARAGLVSLVICGGLVLARSKRGFLSVLIIIALLIAAIPFIATTDWFARMNTLSSVRADDSSMQRVAVWSWTMDYVKSHPWGGGFNVDQTNRFTVEAENEAGEVTISGKAFHSIYFEVLGEHGFLGFLLYFGLIGRVLFRLIKFQRSVKRENRKNNWGREFAIASLFSWAGLLVGCAFIGIAFMPFIFFFLVISLAILTVAKRAAIVVRPGHVPAAKSIL